MRLTRGRPRCSDDHVSISPRNPRLHVALISALVAATFASSCTGSGSSAGANEPSEPRPEERWETVQEWTLASAQHCVTGPFSIDVPAYDAEFGRRFTVEVFGDRHLPMDTSFAYGNGWRSSGWSWSDEDVDAEHVACRGHSETASTSPGTRTGSTTTTPPSGGRTGRTPPPPSGGRTPPAEQPEGPRPTLDPFTGGLPPRKQGHGLAWYPQGNPNLLDIDDVNTAYSEGDDRNGFHFEFWFHRPVDMRGMVIRIRAQVLRPIGSVDRYRAGLAARVADVDRRLAAIETVHVGPSQDPSVGRVPPAPRQETVPRAPRGDVEWLPGYWKFEVEVDDFVWIGGTYVVRAPVPAATQPTTTTTTTTTTTNTPPPPPAVVAPPPPSETETATAPPPARTLEASVPPRPEPRAEVIPPPPGVPGALFIAGYWELRGRAWAWVPGHWQLPTESGARFRPPSVEIRGDARIYLPGRWFRRDR